LQSHYRAQGAVSAQADLRQNLPEDVTIYRDEYGRSAAEIWTRTDASTVFGFAYAAGGGQLLARSKKTTLLRSGRSGEVYRRLRNAGVSAYRVRNRGARDPRIGQKDEYRRLDLHTRAICDAFAAGLNFLSSPSSRSKTRDAYKDGAVVSARFHPLQLLPERIFV
jgi:hypothetical protein